MCLRLPGNQRGDWQRKTDWVLSKLFWKRYEKGEIERAILDVAASASTEVAGDLAFEAGVLAGDGGRGRGRWWWISQANAR